MPRKQSRPSPIDAKGVPRIDTSRSRPAWGIQIAECGAIALHEPVRRIQALIPGRRAQCRAARSGRRRAEVAGLLSRVFGRMLCGKCAGVESCAGIGVQLLEAGIVRVGGCLVYAAESPRQVGQTLMLVGLRGGEVQSAAR